MARTDQLTVSGFPVMVHYPSWHSKDGAGLRGIIACHGHGGSDTQIAEGSSFAGHPEFLAEKGYVVASVSTGNTWLNPTAMSDITALYNWLVGLGITGPKVGLLAWSMGGGHALRWLIENPTLVACGYLAAPLTDLDWAEANASYQAEVQAQYGGSHASYLTQGAPRSPVTNAAAFRGGPKLLIAHATDDATLPYSQTQTFIAAVNDPAVTLRQPDITGDHTAGWQQVPPRESWEFIRTRWAA